MTAYEIITIIIGILSLVTTLLSIIIKLLVDYIKAKNNRPSPQVRLFLTNAYGATVYRRPYIILHLHILQSNASGIYVRM